MLGALVRRHRDFAAAEDALQEALLAASLQWARDGVPTNPRAWLVQVAGRRLVDHTRAEAARRAREARAAGLEADEVPAADDEARVRDDDALELLFTCCHPALSRSAAVALTLRAVGGLTTAEIARAFLVPEATMAQRLVRARQGIKASGVPFEAPGASARRARLGAVMQVIYLVFSEGYAASSGAGIVRVDLAREGVRLGRLLHRLVPDEPEVMGLLALMLLTDARREARTGAAGELVALDAQDRARWDRAAIAEGLALVEAALRQGAVGPYQVQAAIAALHDEAPSAEATDWPQIAALYALLGRMNDSPMVRLSEAVAVAMVEGPARGLERLDALAHDARLAGHHRLDAVRAHLLERHGDVAGAIAAYRRAASRTTSVAERDYLLRQAARLEG